MVSGWSSEVTKGVSNTRTLFLVSLRPVSECSGAGCKKGVEGLWVGTIEGVGVGGLSCLFVIVYVHEKTREPFAN